MTDTHPTIKCRKCGTVFEPDMKTTKPWQCPTCRAKNPNLKRHYRSVADLFILGLIITAIIIAVALNKVGLNLRVMLSTTHGILLLITIVAIYKSRTPWSDSLIKTLIWIVFGLALLFNVMVPLVFAGRLNIPPIVVYAVVFSYLFWLNAQATKCTVCEPAQAPFTGPS